jgi:hypothetical protein
MHSMVIEWTVCLRWRERENQSSPRGAASLRYWDCRIAGIISSISISMLELKLQRYIASPLACKATRDPGRRTPVPRSVRGSFAPHVGGTPREASGTIMHWVIRCSLPRRTALLCSASHSNPNHRTNNATTTTPSYSGLRTGCFLLGDGDDESSTAAWSSPASACIVKEWPHAGPFKEACVLCLPPDVQTRRASQKTFQTT